MNRRSFNRRLFGGVASLFLIPRITMPPVRQQLRVNGERLNTHLRELAQFGRNDKGGITRVAYSDADLAARNYVQGLMRSAGLSVRIDTAGNIIGRREGSSSALAPIMIGSHIDSVPEGGNYDGQVGSMGAIEVAQTIADSRVALSRALEVAIFQNEENGKTGSKAMRGQDPASFLDLTTLSGKTVRNGIRFIGGDPDRIVSARRAPGSIAACLELHIEQGAVLENARMNIGVVQGIVGIKRWNVTATGFANHAGTTPMDKRQDALLAAARFIDAVHRIARATAGRHVATVGTITAEPGAPNVIPGRAILSLEIRDLEMRNIDSLYQKVRAEGETIATGTGTRFEYAEVYRTEPAACESRIQDVIESAARGLGLSTMRLPSGAGHDAQEIAQLAPMGMIFVPSRRGVSHSAEEFTPPDQITAGANVLLHAVQALDRAL